MFRGMTTQPTRPSSAGAGALRTPEARRYEASTELGRGGLGRVALAHDHRLGREVAIKQLAHPSPATRARFVREVQLTAQLEHPGIVPIYDAGVGDDGEPYYAMRRVSGETLSQRVAAATTGPDRLALVPHVLAAAEAVAYAHDRGIVHRDLKPSNILIGARGETIVIDWGVARRTTDPLAPAPVAIAHAPTAPVARPAGDGDAGSGDRPADETSSAAADGATEVTPDDGVTPPTVDSDVVTTAGEVVGTPAFMPPEQAAGAAVDARADVYALGATLYHVLAGSAPYGGSGRKVLTQVVAGPPVPLGERAPGTPPELIAIVERAMARAPEQRYPDASALVTDLRRFLTGRLVGAHQYRPWSLAWWWLRRHRAIALVVAGAALLLAGIGVASVLGIRDERRVARHERDLAARSANRLRLLQARAELERDPTTAAAWLASYRIEPDQVAEVIRVASAAAPSVAADLFAIDGSTVLRICTSSDGRLVVGVDRAGDVHLWDRGRAPVAAVKVGSVGESPASCRFSAGDRAVLVMGRKGALGVVVLATRAWARSPLEPVRRAAWAGERLVVATKDRMYVIDDVAAGAAPREAGPTPGTVVWMTDGPDGQAVAMTGLDGSATVWPLAGSPRPLARHARPLSSIDLAPDGTVVTGAADAVKLHAPAGGVRTTALDHGHDTVVITAAIAGGAMFVDSTTRRLHRWRGDGAPEVIATDVVYDSLAASLDGTRVVWATGDGLVHLLDTTTGAIRDLRGHASGVRDLAISRDGRTIVSASEDATIRVWAPPPPDGAPLPAAAGAITMVAATPGARIVAGDDRGQVTAWQDGAAHVVGALGGPIEWVTVSPDGTRIAASAGPRLTVWRGAGAPPYELTPAEPEMPIGFAADGRVITLSDDRRVRARDDAGGADVLVEAKAPFTGGTVTTDGRWAVVSAFDGLRLIELGGAAPATATVLTGPDVTTFRIAVSADARRVVAGTGAGAVWMWTIGGPAAGTQLGQLRGNITELAFSADGATVAAADESGAIALLPATGGAPRWLHGHDVRVTRLGFTAGGRLVSVDRRGLIRAWDPATGASAVVGEHRARVRQIVVAGETVVAFGERSEAMAGGGSAPRVWHLDRVTLTPADPQALERWAANLTRARVDLATGVAATAP